MFHNTEKAETRQWKFTTSLIRRQNLNGEVVDRSWLCFLLDKLMFIVSLAD